MVFKRLKKIIFNIKNKLKSIRNNFIKKEIRKNISENFNSEYYYWQPWYFIFIKIIIGIFIIIFIYNLHVDIGRLMFKGFSFFKLDEIFKFKVPDENFFIKISKYLFLIIIIYHSFLFFIPQIRGLFSSLVVCKTQKSFYYVNNKILSKHFFVFNFNTINNIQLKQNFLLKYLNIGTIIISKNDSKEIIIKSVYKAADAIKNINEVLTKQNATLPATEE
jgi:hypothetical protein